MAVTGTEAVVDIKVEAAAIAREGDGVTETVVDIKVEAAATTREGDGVTETGAEVKEAEARVMVGDEAVLEEVMEAGLVGDGVEQDLPTMDHPSKLRRHTTGQ